MGRAAVLRAVFVGVVSAICAACIPPRDNPNEPEPQPEIVLRVGVRDPGDETTDYTRKDGGQKTVFYFDLTDSTDPKGREITCAFELDDERWDAGADLDYETPGTESNGCILATTLALTTGMLPSGAGITTRFVRAQVRAGDGEAHADVEVVLHNEAPIANGGEDLIISLSEPEVVIDACGGARLEEDCTSTDPDGDPLHFEWTAPPGVTLVPEDTANRRMRFQPSGGKPAYAFTFQAKDNLASDVGTVSVHLGEAVWIGLEDTTRLLRLFPDQTRTLTTYTGTAGTTNFSSYMDAVAALDDGTILIANPIVSPTIPVLRLDRDGDVLEQWEIDAFAGQDPVQVRSLAAGCAVVRYGGGKSTFTRLLADDSTVDVEDSQAGMYPAEASHVFAAPNGDCWTVGKNVGLLTPAGTWSNASDLTFTDTFTATTLEDGGLCVSAATAAGGVGLWCIPPGGGPAVEIPPTDPPVFVSALVESPDGSDTLIAHDAQTGLLARIDRVTGEAQFFTGLDPIAFTNGMMARSSLDSAFWIVDATAGILRRATPAGTGLLISATQSLGELLPTGSYRVTSLAIDPETADAITVFRYLNSTAPNGAIVRMPWHGRTIDEVPGPALLRVRLRNDPTRGTLWFSDGGNSFLSPGIQVRTDLGRVPATLGESPIFTHVTVGTEGAWAARRMGSLELVRLDPLANVIEAETIPLDSPPRSVQEMAASRNDRFVCMASTPDFQGMNGDPIELARCDRQSLSCTTLTVPGAPLTVLGSAFPTSKLTDVVSADDGSCSFLTSSPFPYDQGRFLSYPGLSTTPAADMTVDSSDAYFLCDRMQLDERDGSIWYATQYQGIRHISPLGADLGTFVNGDFSLCLQVEKVCDDAGDPACLEVWHVTDYSTLVRADGALNILQTFDLGGGFITALSVRR